MKVLAAFCFLVLLSGCLTSGVVPTGPDSYMAHGHSTYFTFDAQGDGALANTLELAAEFCAKMGKTMAIQSTEHHHNIGAGGTATVDFECVSPNDQDYVRPHLRPIVPGTGPGVVVNNQNGPNGQSDDAMKLAKARELMVEAIEEGRKASTEPCIPNTDERQRAVADYGRAHAMDVASVAAELPDETKARQVAALMAIRAHTALGGWTCHPPGESAHPDHTGN